MEGTEKYESTFNVVATGEDSSSSVFPELKHYCVELLELLQKPRKNPSAPSQLLQLLRRSPSYSLQPFFDYALFPLLLLLDAAVESKSTSKIDAKGRSVMSGAAEVPHRVSDFVAEGVLNCLEELLHKCTLVSVDQMVVLLKKLTRGALLSPLEAPEEFRIGIIKCFKALLLCLHPCSDELCLCKQIDDLPMLLARKDFQSSLTKVPKHHSEPEQCLIAFLQSKSASAAIGHWLSLLLQTADVEASRGHRGSATLRVEALTTVRVLIAKVGNADALAFFLPGVVSQIGKVLHTSKTMISGAAGSTETLDQAIRGLAEFLSIVLEDGQNLPSLGESQDEISNLHKNKQNSLLSFLDEFRQLPLKTHDQDDIVVKNLSEAVHKGTLISDIKEDGSVNPDGTRGTLRVNRTKEWIVNTSSHINKLLSATFPHLCIHPSKKVRQGILAAIQTLVLKCCYTLKESRLLLLESLCLLVYDDSEEVSSAAQAFFGFLFSSSRKSQMEHDVVVIFSRLVEKLTQVVLGNQESLVLSHARKLLVVIYFSGPQFVLTFLCQSPVTAARFLDALALCLSQNSVFAGSLDKLVLARSPGYMHSIAEMKAISDGGSKVVLDKLSYPSKSMQKAYELPRMPPWFIYVGNEKLYDALAGVLRLVGLALFADSRSQGSLSVVIDIPLVYLRKLISEVRTMEYSMLSWESWYNRTGSGQLVRQASTAACILNEMIFGLSDQATSTVTNFFKSSSLRWQEIKCYDANGNLEQPVPDKIYWKVCWDNGARNYLIDCVGSILHEYLSSELWNLPLEHATSVQQSDSGGGSLSLHFFHDNAMLHQVIIEGIGIFTMCLGKEFSSSGFLHSSLFLLLENLICSNFQVRSASDAVLHVIAATLDYQTVGHLVLANSDYVIDSICRQLRHLDLSPHMPNVLAAMLSYIGIGHKILPLLEEPMRAVSLELEILGRHQHPNLTIPFLKAVAEIVKAAKHEACSLPSQVEAFHKDVKSDIFDVEKKLGKDSCSSRSSSQNNTNLDATESGMGICSSNVNMQIEHWESILFKLNNSRRYRRTVGSVANSCLIAATPLLASTKQAACLLAFDVIEDGILALGKVEDVYKHEKETKEALEEMFSSCSLDDLQDSLDTAADEATENRLLPAMNKIWPFLVCCMRNKNPVAVRRCSQTISNLVQVCGGDFFSRRFHTDGIHFWKLLSTSPFQRKAISKEERIPLQLPYRSTWTSSEDGVAELSDLKVQAAVLDMIAAIAQNKRSCSALEAVLKKVSGLVVGIACSGVTGLRNAATNALVGLASIDPDLIWLLLADVYFSLEKKDVPSPPGEEFPEVSQILPPPLSSNGYLYVVYGGQSFGFDIDFSAVVHVFKTLHAKISASQIVQLE